MADKPKRLVTRVVLEEVRQQIGGTEESVLEWMQRASGWEIEVIDDFPSGEEQFYHVGTPDRVLARDVESRCTACGGPVFHRPGLPPNAVPICADCAEGMAQAS